MKRKLFGVSIKAHLIILVIAAAVTAVFYWFVRTIAENTCGGC